MWHIRSRWCVIIVTIYVSRRGDVIHLVLCQTCLRVTISVASVRLETPLTALWLSSPLTSIIACVSLISSTPLVVWVTVVRVSVIRECEIT